MNHDFQCGRFQLALARPHVMGIVNVTPDSFSDGGCHGRADQAIAHARQLLNDGVDILDLGGESTRPGADPVSAADELARLLPVIEGVRDLGVPVSVDTCKPEVMRAVLDAGADMINDIYGFRLPGAIEAVAASDCGLCVMHMQGEPRTMQQAPVYGDLLEDVSDFLRKQVAQLRAAGIQGHRLTLDPGFGFGKTAEQNYLLLRRLDRLQELELPLLIGLSRKSMIGHVVDRPPQARVAGSVAGALAAVARGAAIVRVHDVAQTVDALRVWQAVETAA